MKAVVAGYNATAACRIALERATTLAEQSQATLHVVSVQLPVVPVGGFGWVAPYDEIRPLQELAKAHVEQAAARVGSRARVSTHALFGRPAVELVRVAKETDADLIVVGGVHRSALDRIFVGSTAERVVRLTPVPSVVAAAEDCGRRILAGVDDSAFGEAAATAALELAAVTGGKVRCVHVLGRQPEALKSEFQLDALAPTVADYVQKFVEGVRGKVADAPPAEAVVRTGDVCEEILAEAKDFEADLIVAGSHGRNFVGRAILGSASEYLLRHAPVSVMVAPGRRD